MTLTPTETSAPPMRRRSRGDRIVRVIGIVGRVFVAAGLILLFFTGYMLWGTGIYTKQEQDRLTQELAADPIVAQDLQEGDEIPPARPAQLPEPGAGLFSMKVPAIGLDTAVVHGVGREALKKGPGLFPDCDDVGGDCVPDAMFPGEDGNVAISGHRTTYGAPFFRMNEVQEGDIIDMVSGQARYRYRVRSQEIVDPVGGFDRVLQHGRAELTLTTCHPRFSAAQRLIINADYEGATLVGAPAGGGGASPPTSGASQPVVAPDVLALVSIALAAALGSLALSRRYRNVAAYIALGIVGASGLWVGIFPRIIALMPANY